MSFLFAQLMRVENPAEPRSSSANSYISCRENRMLCCKVMRSALHPILAITEAKTSTRFTAAPQDFLPAFAIRGLKAALFVALKR